MKINDYKWHLRTKLNWNCTELNVTQSNLNNYSHCIHAQRYRMTGTYDLNMTVTQQLLQHTSRGQQTVKESERERAGEKPLKIF